MKICFVPLLVITLLQPAETLFGQAEPAPAPETESPRLPIVTAVHPFWIAEERLAKQNILLLTVPAGMKLVLYQNLNPLQFHAHRGVLHPLKLNLGEPELIPQSRADISSRLKQYPGNYILLCIPESITIQPGVPPLRYELPLLHSGGEQHELINIISETSSAANLRVEMESILRDGEAGEYRQFPINGIFLEWQ